MSGASGDYPLVGYATLAAAMAAFAHITRKRTAVTLGLDSVELTRGAVRSLPLERLLACTRDGDIVAFHGAAGRVLVDFDGVFDLRGGALVPRAQVVADEVEAERTNYVARAPVRAVASRLARGDSNASELLRARVGDAATARVRVAVDDAPPRVAAELAALEEELVGQPIKMRASSAWSTI